MLAFFIDTSALLKNYVVESGSQWVTSIVTPQADVQLYVAQITQAECAATICRLARLTPPRLTIAERDTALGIFADAWTQDFTVIPFTQTISDATVILCAKHALYGMDAIQLASALALQAAIAPAQVSLTFLCADNRLLTAAHAEGLATDNPLDHP